MLSKPFISLLLLAAVSQTIAAQGATSVLVCADIEKNELRLKCYDKVAKELAKDASSQRKPQSKFSDVEKAQIDADLDSAYYAIKKMYAEMALRLAESEAKRAKNNDPQTQVAD